MEQSNAIFMNNATTTVQDSKIAGSIIDGIAIMVTAVMDRSNFVRTAIKVLMK